MKAILLGTGTSHGIPVIGCKCPVCTSTDPRDNRTRCSMYLESPEKLLFDVGPEFRIQAIREGIKEVTATFITHSHADHLHGIDDLRIFSHSQAFDPFSKSGAETQGEGMCLYAGSNSIEDIKKRFDYIFREAYQGGGKPKIKPVDMNQFSKDNPLKIGSVEILPVPLKHGYLDDCGYLLSETKDGQKKSMAYLTDCNFIPDSSIELVKENAGELVHVVIDGLREKNHSTHFSFDEALTAADRLAPKNTWLTHITHNNSHASVCEYIESRLNLYPNLEAASKNGGKVEAAYDGLVLET